jgi:hypothetical protein
MNRFTSFLTSMNIIFALESIVPFFKQIRNRRFSLGEKTEKKRFISSEVFKLVSWTLGLTKLKNIQTNKINNTFIQYNLFHVIKRSSLYFWPSNICQLEYHWYLETFLREAGYFTKEQKAQTQNRTQFFRDWPEFSYFKQISEQNLLVISRS